MKEFKIKDKPSKSIIVVAKDILPNPYRKLDELPLFENKIESLIKVFKSKRFIENLAGRINKDGKVELIYGHHRLEAVKRLYGENFKFRITIYDVNEEDMFTFMIEENALQKDITPIEIDFYIKEAIDFLQGDEDIAWKYGYLDKGKNGKVMVTSDHQFEVGKVMLFRFLNNIKALNDKRNIDSYVPFKEINVYDKSILWNSRKIGQSLRRIEFLKGRENLKPQFYEIKSSRVLEEFIRCATDTTYSTYMKEEDYTSILTYLNTPDEKGKYLGRLKVEKLFQDVLLDNPDSILKTEFEEALIKSNREKSEREENKFRKQLEEKGIGVNVSDGFDSDYKKTSDVYDLLSAFTHASRIYRTHLEAVERSMDALFNDSVPHLIKMEALLAVKNTADLGVKFQEKVTNRYLLDIDEYENSDEEQKMIEIG